MGSSWTGVATAALGVLAANVVAVVAAREVPLKLRVDLQVGRGDKQSKTGRTRPTAPDDERKWHREV